MLPEVVLLAETENALGRNADILVPNLKCFLVVLINGRIQAVWVDTNPLRAGQKFPAPRDRFLFEVITKREVAQHFKERTVARSLADVFDIARSDAFLASRYAMARRLLFASEVRLHRRHARVDQQQRRVVLRDERKARQAEMPLGLKKLQVHFAQFV